MESRLCALCSVQGCGSAVSLEAAPGYSGLEFRCSSEGRPICRETASKVLATAELCFVACAECAVSACTASANPVSLLVAHAVFGSELSLDSYIW